MSLSPDEATSSASHEWSLISSLSEMGGMSDPDFVDQDGRLLSHLTSMRDNAPEKSKQHYTATIDALRRMVALRDGWIPGEDDDRDADGNWLSVHPDII
jgi:hypothetical protein